MQINLYTMQQIQQVYQSQLMVSSVHGENRMKEAVREVPRFSVPRATEPVARKVTPPVESVIDEKAAMPAMYYRAIGVGRNVDSSRSANSSYTAAMAMAASPADYVDYNHGMAFDVFY